MSGALTNAVAADDLQLVVNGTSIGGWTSVRVTRGLERIPAIFDIELTERAPSGFQAIVTEGDPCTVKIGPDLVITGYIDACDYSIEPGAHNIRIMGRSKSQDFVDASAEYTGCQFVNSNVLTIMQHLAKPYGITVKAAGDVGPVIPLLNFSLGDTAHDVCERICRYGALLYYDQPDGSILLTAVGTKRAASGFAEGQNVQSARATFRVDQRFSAYRAFVLAVDIFKDVSADGNMITSERDPNVKRHREKFFVAETGDSGFAVAQKRAKWLAARQAGRGRQVRIVCDSWRDSSGKLWEPNTLVSVNLPSLKVNNEQLLISEVAYRRDGDRGTVAELVLMPSTAFTVEPVLLFPRPQNIKPAASTPGTNR